MVASWVGGAAPFLKKVGQKYFIGVLPGNAVEL